jgi:hypothetical protein
MKEKSLFATPWVTSFGLVDEDIAVQGISTCLGSNHRRRAMFPNKNFLHTSRPVLFY